MIRLTTKYSIPGAVFLLLACLSAGSAHAVTINFDEIATGPDGTVQIPQDQYADLGVLLSVQSQILSGDLVTVVAEPVFGNGATSDPNGAAFGFLDHVLIAEFVDPLSGAAGVTDFFSAYVGDLSSEADPMTVTALDINGGVLGTASFTSQPNNILGQQDFGLVSLAAAGIHRLIFSDASPSGATLDDLTFNPVTAAGGGGGGEPIPEPATLGLLLTGLLGGVHCRRKKQSNG